MPAPTGVSGCQHRPESAGTGGSASHHIAYLSESIIAGVKSNKKNLKNVLSMASQICHEQAILQGTLQAKPVMSREESPLARRSAGQACPERFFYY